MKLSVRDGKLRLRSAFKLIFFGWVFGIGGFFALIFLLMMLIALAGGPIDINGETVSGSAAFIQMLPMMILLPVIIVFQGAIFSGLMVLGLLIYRLFWPIRVDGAISPSVFE
ncbi:hypothetical protein [Hyphobacterium sp.]|uniref:hypothetical protein n=1 Tax=Hyphobacterium sp. TaxID=2004662 RepID=UPI00374817D1